MNKVTMDDCWTRGGEKIVYQHCSACGRQWLFQRGFCPHCGTAEPQPRASAARGVVSATALVHRAPDDTFRALVPYRLVLVELDEGLRLMAHADPAVAVGDRVRGGVRRVADRALPYFEKDVPA
jgi:uncharacterized OB-fold protein